MSLFYRYTFIIILSLTHIVQAEQHYRSMKYTSRSKEQAIAWQNELRM